MFWTSEKKFNRKAIEHSKFAVNYALRMREDKMSDDERNELLALKAEIRRRLKQKDYDGGHDFAETAVERANAIHPAPGGQYGIRENIEVFAVVISVVMAFRTFVAQPYQIPTGSMQPTLYGITADTSYEKNWTDTWGPNILKFILTGGWYQEFVAEHDGILAPVSESGDNNVLLAIHSPSQKQLSSYKMHKDYYPDAMNGNVRRARRVKKGDVIAKGIRKMGDHVVVNRLAYNFAKPKRGDVVVFSTRDLEYVRPNSSYIKRLVALPGERVRICDGKLFVNDEIVREPAHFARQSDDERYEGYSNGRMRGVTDPAQILRYCEEEYTLAEGEFLFLGDNTNNSLDGRWFGGVPGHNIIGPAVLVPWPFLNRGIYGENAGRIW